MLVILVLGEMVGATVTGVHDMRWAAGAVAIAVIGFVVAATLWWNYFDVGAASGTESLQARERDEPQDLAEESDEDEGDRHDLFIYGHLPLTLGIAAAGVGLEEFVLHSDTALQSARRLDAGRRHRDVLRRCGGDRGRRRLPVADRMAVASGRCPGRCLPRVGARHVPHRDHSAHRNGHAGHGHLRYTGPTGRGGTCWLRASRRGRRFAGIGS